MPLIDAAGTRVARIKPDRVKKSTPPERIWLDEHLYVREQEWEAAHTVWLWPDRSPSMAFRSTLAQESKLDRVWSSLSPLLKFWCRPANASVSPA